MFSEKEIAVLEKIFKKSSTSQREVAKESGISLGLINNILNKFAKTGHIKKLNVNGKNIRYTLTEKGTSLVSQTALDYLVKTIQRYRSTQGKILKRVEGLIVEGRRDFVIRSDGEFGELIEGIFHEDLAGRASLRKGLDEWTSDTVLLCIGEVAVPPGYDGKVIDLLLEVIK